MERQGIEVFLAREPHFARTVQAAIARATATCHGTTGELRLGYLSATTSIYVRVILVCGVLMLAPGRWWWHPVFAVLIAFWIVVVGTVADQLPPNLTSHNLGTVGGTVVMAFGLIVAAIAGVAAMVTGRRARAARRGVTT